MKRIVSQTASKIPRELLLLLTAVILTSAASGCAGNSLEEVDRSALQNMPLEIDVFSARGFLGGSEYERYYLTDDLLWRECGSISKEKPKQQPEALKGDHVFKEDPNLAIEQRRVESVGGSEQLELKVRVAQLLKLLSAEEQEPPAPGSFFSLSDPGLFELHLTLGKQKKRVITSVDAVADKDSLPLSKAHELFSALRSVGPVICNSQTFFGIARLDLPQ